MASIYFVCHPYNTPHIVKHTICRWNTTRDHWRKLLMSLRSKYIDCNDRKLKEGDICFVGEWECCSECRPCPTTNILFKDIHQPFITEMDNYQHILSTDPFVFGPRFYYTCCKKERTREMTSGDIVIFGSYKKSLPNKIIVDTVMVLNERIEMLGQPEHKFPYGYTHTTLSRIHPNDWVWSGMMYDDLLCSDDAKMFSFVPCLPLQEGKQIKPIYIPCAIDDTLLGYKIKYGQNVNPLAVPAKDLKLIYDEIIRQVAAAGFCLGVRMPMPKKREVSDILE